jgi:Zn-dependent peptidase ImmA (M78 family)
VDIAKASGIDVFTSDLKEYGASGLITYQDEKTKSGAKIYIEQSDPESRKLFTLAHEFGHHVLHQGTKWRLDSMDYSRADVNPQEETEANYFAACLLVPKNDLIAKKHEFNNDLVKIADSFQVSPAVINIRLDWLN